MQTARTNRTQQWPLAAALALGLIGIALSSVVQGQEPAEVRGPTPEDIARFHEESRGISEHSVRRAGIEIARRHAPFDLTWGLQ